MNQAVALLIVTLTLPLSFVPDARAEECPYTIEQACVPGPGGIDVSGLPQLYLGEDLDLERAILDLANPQQKSGVFQQIPSEVKGLLRIQCGGDSDSYACIVLDLLNDEVIPRNLASTLVNAVNNACEEENCDAIVDAIMECVQTICVNHPLIDELRECVPDDCVDPDPYRDIILGLVDTALRELESQCETGDRCNPDRIVQDVTGIVQDARQTLCGSKSTDQCITDRIPNPCPSNPVGSTISIPSGTRDDDGDGVPRIVVQRTRAEVNSECQLATSPQGSDTVDAPDYNDNDPNEPPPATYACETVYPPTIGTAQPGTSPIITEDNDGDGIPYYRYKRQSVTVEDDCSVTTGPMNPFGIGPDPDDNDPNDPVSQTPCGPLGSYTQLVPTSYSTTDQDDDGIPIITLVQRYYSVQSDCSLTSTPGPPVSYALDPDDNDPNNPAPINQPPCTGQERAFWIPLDYQTEDQDGDQVPVYRVVDAEYTIGDDCVPRKTATRVNPTEYGDPDDEDPDVPVDRTPEPCTPQSVWIPYRTQTRDQDEDGVPQYQIEDHRVQIQANCLYQDTYEYRPNGPWIGDPDDEDPSDPGYDCSQWNPQFTPHLPNGFAGIEDADEDGIPTIYTKRARLQLTPDCTPYLLDVGTHNEGLPDPWDDNPDRPISQSLCLQPTNERTIPWAPIITDDDGDKVPLLHGQERTYELAPDCTLTYRRTEPTGATWGDPDDQDPSNPVCSSLPVPSARLPTGNITTRDQDNDGIPRIAYETALYDLGADCTLRRTDYQDEWLAGPDTDDQDPEVPLDPTPEPCPAEQWNAPWVPIIEDKDDDGVPVVYRTSTDVLLSPDCTVEYRGLYIHEGYGDLDDNDPLVPVNCLALADQHPRLPTGGSLLVDEDGDGIPRTAYWTAEHHFTPDCQFITSDPRLESIDAPDPDDANPNDPVSITEPCWRQAGTLVPMVRIAEQTDDDLDGVPALEVEVRWSRMEADCSQTDNGVVTTQSLGDPNDDDPDNPMTQEPCEPVAGIHWVPSSYRQEDLDDDGVPLVTIVEHGILVAPDCGESQETEQTRDGQQIGDPDDQDPYNPVPDPGALCPGAGQDCRLVLTAPTGGQRVEDLDGDGVPAAYVQVADLELRYNPGNPGLGFQEGSESWVRIGGDTNDADPDEPVPRDPKPCEAIQGAILDAPAGYEVLDDDMDGTPRVLVSTQQQQLADDCSLVPIGPVQTTDLGPDPDDNDDTTPLDSATACQDVAGQYRRPDSVALADADDDGIPRITIMERNLVIQDDCGINQGMDDLVGESVGDPDDADADNPVPRTLTPCAPFAGTQVPVPEGPPTTQDLDNDGVPSIAQSLRWYVIGPDCTLVPTLESYPVSIGPDPDDQNPFNPLPALTPCQGLDGPRWLAESYEVRDQDDDGVPLIVVKERSYTIGSDCSITPGPNRRDSVVQAGDDDTDPNAPIPQDPTPCAALAPYSLLVPDGAFQIVDEDEDGWPVLRQPMKTAEITPDCQVTNEPGDDLVLAVDNNDNDPYRPPAAECQAAPPWNLPGDPVITDQDNDGIPQIHAPLMEYRLDAECRPYPTGNTTEGARMGDPDDDDPLLPGDLGDLCPGQASPCLLGEVSIPTACRIEDQDEDGISSAYLCTQAYRFHSDGTIASSEPVEFIGPLGDVDDQNPARPIPYYLTDDVWRLSDELLDDVAQVLWDVDDAQKGLLGVVLDASNSTTDQIQHHREHLLQEIQHGITTLTRLRGDAETFMACAGARTDQYAALMDNRITSAANDPSPDNLDSLALAATDGAAIHATNLRACNGASQTLDFLYQEVRVLCGQGLHYTGFAGHLLAESEAPLVDLDRLFSPRSNTINETLHACLEAPYQLARQLVAYTETTADRLTRLLLAYTDLVGSELLDTIRNLLEPKYHDADAPKAQPWSFPLFLLAIALLASTRRWRRR